VRGAITLSGAADVAIGFAAEGVAARLVIQCSALGAALTVKARVIGSGLAYSAIQVKNRATDAMAATAAAAGVYEVDCTGLDIQLSFAGTATYSYQFVAA
jgi:hypothetical protein